MEIYSPTYKLNNKIYNNDVYIKRDDLIPFSFGGNKVRKAFKFFEEIVTGQYNHVITYGSSSSNHCRVVANLAKLHNIKCTIVSIKGDKRTFNSSMVEGFGAHIVYSELDRVSNTIELVKKESEKGGYKTYFIPGGGHGNLGTEAYFDAYEEIKCFEKSKNLNFDYIFLASGTGGTQAGLVCGSMMAEDNKNIIGISIGRPKNKGLPIIQSSVKSFLESKNKSISIDYLNKIIFEDEYLCDGYGKYNDSIIDTVSNVLNNEGIPLDNTYTGKAFWGMTEFLKKRKIHKKNILFVHTGGTPLYFSDNIEK